MTFWNYVGWAWIVWTLFNEGLAMMDSKPYIKNASTFTGILSWVLSGLAVWAALS